MLKTPPMQTATATIDTLCGRLQSATLLEDRRSAIMGLRSFAKQYPASVAGGSLRELITILRRDGLGEAGDAKSSEEKSSEGGDVDTIRLVLETLLMLFNPDSNSPEASEEMALFMADEFSMRQDNVGLLLSFLDPTSPVADYYSRLYSIQLLTAICAARLERLQECVLGIPLGVSRVVGVLDDPRDAVRNAGLILLIDLTTGANDELRKIVAFEDVFSKVFALIRVEGGLGEAGITAQDCLSLLANLVRNSVSNQTMFRESGCVSQLQALLQEALPNLSQAEAGYITQNREKAAWGLLQLLSFFISPGQANTAQNQTTFFRVGAAQTLIDLAYAETLPLPIRIASLKNVALLINLNPPLQENFAGLSVRLQAASQESSPDIPQTNGHTAKGADAGKKEAGHASAYVIEALLDLALRQVQQEFGLRSAATEVIEAYLRGHPRIKSHFLQRAIGGHGEHETAANVLTTLLHPESDLAATTLAARILADLTHETLETKQEFAAIKEGNESEGEDVLTAIQLLGAHLREALLNDPDTRFVAAYAGLLTVLLWDFAHGVDQLLAEGSSLLQALISAADVSANPPILAGLSAVLIGTIYEFSTKDSPISRRTMAPILTQKLGRTKYLDALSGMRRDPVVRDFDVEDAADEDSLLSRPFIDLFTVEYTRLQKAIDKDPGIEVVHTNAAGAGIDRDVLDSLREEITSLKTALSTAEQNAAESQQEHERQRVLSGQEHQKTVVELERIRKINVSIQQNHEKEYDQTTKSHEKQIQQLKIDHARALADARQDEKRQAQSATQEKDRKHNEKIQEYERRLAELGNTHRNEQSGHNATRQALEALTTKHKEISTREVGLARELADFTARFAKAQRDLQDAQSQASMAVSELSKLRPRAEQLESEVERLNKGRGELEAELNTRNAELTAERAGFGELEKELESSRARVSVLEKAQVDAKNQQTRTNEIEKTLATEKNKTSQLEKELAAEKSKGRTADQDLSQSKSKVTSLEKELKTLREEIKTLQSRLTSSADKSGAAKTTVDQLRKDVSAKDEKIAKLEKEVQTAKKALTTAQNSKANGKADRGADTAAMAKLEKQVTEAREAEKAAKEELDSMLLVMGDIEAKRDTYRAKVKALGGEVSEDDGEDDEDEEEDDDEDAAKHNSDDDVD